MQTRAVESISARRLNGVFDVDHEFAPGINIIYGPNGIGKTTLLHILANALAGEYERFAFLQFDTIELGLGDGTRLRIDRAAREDHTVSVETRVNGDLIARTLASFRPAEDRPPRTLIPPMKP